MWLFLNRSRCFNWETWHSTSLCTIVDEVEWAGKDEKWSAGSVWVWTAPDLRSYSIGTTCGRRGNRYKCNAGIRYCVLEVSSCECLSWIHSWCSYSGAKRFYRYSPRSTGNRWAFLEKNNCSRQALSRERFQFFLLISWRHTVYCLVEERKSIFQSVCQFQIQSTNNTRECPGSTKAFLTSVSVKWSKWQI